jgi:hypothetical protein
MGDDAGRAARLGDQAVTVDVVDIDWAGSGSQRNTGSVAGTEATVVAKPSA